MVYIIEVCGRLASKIRMGEQDQDVPSWSCSQAVRKPVWRVPLLYVQWKTPDDGQRKCATYVQFYSKNKFEKLVHLVGFIVRNFITMHGYMNVKSYNSYKEMGTAKTNIWRQHLLHDEAMKLIPPDRCFQMYEYKYLTLYSVNFVHTEYRWRCFCPLMSLIRYIFRALTFKNRAFYI